MPGKGPLNYTTTIPAAKTVVECQAMLAASGASSVSVHFEDGRPSGLSFTLRTPHGVRGFDLPVNIDGVQQMLADANRDGRLRSDGHRNTRLEGREHAADVAWRVVKDWIEAFLADRGADGDDRRSDAAVPEGRPGANPLAGVPGARAGGP